MKTTAARLQTFERDKPGDPWRAIGAAEPANIGRAGMAWSYAFRRFASRGEPVKVEGDKRTPAGVYAAGRSFGTLPSQRPGYLHVSSDTVCVDDVSSAAYNTIVSRRSIGPKVRVENMGRILPLYRRGIVVDYPTNASVRGGSCIFIHVWRTPATGTSGCVALPEARVEALQDFTDAGAAIAILPRHALDRMRGCLPDEAVARTDAGAFSGEVGTGSP
jgi:D-alanyl-D-alanine dipeptidase